MFGKKFDKTHNQTWDDFLKFQASLFVKDEITLLKFFGLNAGHSPFLDLGCGNGHFSFELAKTFENTRFICADGNKSLLAALSSSLPKHLAKRFQVVKWSAGHEPPPKIISTARAVLMRMVLQHALDPIKTLKELRATLKKSTDIFIIEDDLSYYQIDPPLKAFDRWRQIVHTYCTSQKSDVYIGKKIPRLAQNAGLKVLDTRFLIHSNANLGTNRLMDFFRGTLILCARTSKGVVTEKEARQLIKQFDHFVDQNGDGCFFYHPFIVTHAKT